ncbi:D-alanyl-D-alanine carboxypeptidase family protein [Streptomyces sp. NRRL B-24720]|uniref:D-alanyl-D-alanine carboxypeptidase family protein n=1 Tax=Streptomyces sp. NRRL B-24720 TaxID=1476876 RepID=UPI0004C7E814|nr:D-alanyl-D-alanine carboxypeptidase [Streptomyces sp. NRRL B-24720]
MAGESPDRSEQQKSSGAARSESDPRLAVFRDTAAAADAGTGTATGTRGNPDTATAVFRTKPAESGEGERQDSREGLGEVLDGSRNGSHGSHGPERAEKAPEAREGAPGPEEPEESEEGARAAETAGSADEAGTGTAPEEGDARLRAAVAAWVGKGTVGAKAAEQDEQDEKSERDEKSDAVAVTGSDDLTGSDTPEIADETGDCGTTSAGATGDGSDGLDGSDGSGEPAASDAVDADAADEDDADEARAEGAGKAAASDDAEAEGPGEAEDEGTDGAADEARVPGAPEESAEGAETVEAADAGEVSKASEAAESAESSEPAEDKRAIDQPTAVFRTVRPDRVDQPTTALKITPPASKTEQKPQQKPEAEPESAAERTSRFVPLRRDEAPPAPAVRKPETPAAPPASAAAPSLSGAERTRQQPMPPRPPLDLLAELTNTPPPPETPVRTAVRRVKIWTPLVILLLIVFAIVQEVRPLPTPELRLTAQSTYTFEGSKPSLPWPNEGQGYMAATGLGTVDSFGEQKAVPIGSVAKAMTAYVVLKDHPLKKGEAGPSITVDAKGESDGKLDTTGESTLNTVKAGDKLTEQEALSAIMIPSANNIARLLARWDAGSEEAFVKKMNDTAKSLGMKNTTYTDPSGLTATTVSSAEDQVKLGQKLVEIPALMAITKLPSWTDPSGKLWRNYNTLVPYDGALGIKTGSTTKAGGNLLFAAHKMVGDTDQLIVGAVLGQHKPAIIDTVNAVSKDVMLATENLLKSGKVVRKGDVVGMVDNGFGGTTPVVATEDVAAVGWPGLTVKLELTDDGKTLPHEAAAGTHVGTLTVGEGSSQVKVAVALQSDLTNPSFGQKLTRVS